MNKANRVGYSANSLQGKPSSHALVDNTPTITYATIVINAAIAIVGAIIVLVLRKQ